MFVLRKINMSLHFFLQCVEYAMSYSLNGSLKFLEIPTLSRIPDILGNPEIFGNPTRPDFGFPKFPGSRIPLVAAHEIADSRREV